MTRCVSLFRGINVGGNQKVSMSELKMLHEALELKDVATYINTGNVVFTCDETEVSTLSQKIEQSFAEKFGYKVDVMLRTADQIDAIVARNPFKDQPEKELKWIVVLFLAKEPPASALEDLRKAYSGPEEFYLLGKELIIYYPNSIGQSKLSNSTLDKNLKTSGTGRNWNTVLKLQKMLS